jgi:hypothetical protein
MPFSNTSALRLEAQDFSYIRMHYSSNIASDEDFFPTGPMDRKLFSSVRMDYCRMDLVNVKFVKKHVDIRVGAFQVLTHI